MNINKSSCDSIFFFFLVLDGELEFYQSICDTLKDKKAEEELSEEEIKLFIMRKNVRKKMIFSIKKTESMLVLYIKISEELKLDTTSFTLHLDGDKIKWSDTVKSLDLEGDECLELHEK